MLILPMPLRRRLAVQAIHRIEETAMLSVTTPAADAEAGASGAGAANGAEAAAGSSLVRGGRRLLHAATSGLAARLQLTG